MLVTIAAIGFTSCSIVSYTAAKTYKRSITEGPFDAIIVPGIPYDSLKTNRILMARMYWAKHLYEKGIAANIIFSGAAVHTPFVEAIAMKIIADSLGIPSQHTFIEHHALHSTENVDYGMALADSLGFKKVAVATDPFQALFLRLHIKDRQLPIAVLPFELDSMKTFNRPLPAINYSEAYVHNFIPLRDR
ncbi:MAG: YdcF family protein [Chitinophagales bacterium]|nr:YdcF family protein [Chitinophagales bacterium]